MSSGTKDFVAGCVGGMFQVLSGHPLDTLKVRLQTSGSPGAPVFNGMMDCARKTIKAEGVCFSNFDQFFSCSQKQKY